MIEHVCNIEGNSQIYWINFIQHLIILDLPYNVYLLGFNDNVFCHFCRCFGCSIGASTNCERVIITMICDVACKVVVYSEVVTFEAPLTCKTWNML